MNKQIIVNFLKYAVAIGLMAWVIRSNWGDPRGTVGKIIVGGEPEKGKIAGKVLAYKPNESIRIERYPFVAASGPLAERPASEPLAATERVEFALKAKGKTAIVSTNGATLEPGAVVTLSDISRGLAYVWQQHIERGEPIHTGYLILAFAIALPSILLTFVRWYILVRAVELPFRAIDAFRLGFIGLFFNNFMPGSVGGDVIKAAVLAREQDRRTVAVATVLMDRAIALWALIWFVALLGAGFWMSGLLTGLGAEQCRKIVIIAWAIIALSVLGWIALGLLPNRRAQRFAGRLERLPKVGGAAAELWRAVWMYRCRPRAVGLVLLLSWIGHVGFVFLFYFAVRTLWQPDSGEQVPSLAQHFLIVPIGLVIQAAPFFPGGAGIGELGFGLLYQWLGCSEASGVLGSLVQRVINWTLGLLGGLMYLRMRSALQSAIRPPLSAIRPSLSAVGEAD